jgi:predicted MFS family arabinose efflux permease
MTRRYDWSLIVLAGALIMAINMGIRQTFGLYVVPVSQDLGLGREVFSLSIALVNLVWGAASPFAGAVADKYGSGKVILGGSILYAAGLLIMSAAPNGATLITSGVLIGLGISATGFSAVFGAVGRAAPPEKRQLALSLTTVGSAVGQFLALPYAHVLMDVHGWAFSLLVLAATVAIMALLGTILSGKPVDTGESKQTMTDALREASGHLGFWLLTAGFFVCGFHIAVVAVHLPAFLSDQGFPAKLGVHALMLIGLANIAGSYLCGRAGEIIEKRLALTLLYLARAVIFAAFLAFPVTQTGVLVFSVALGLLWLGTIPLTSGLITVFFGTRWLSMLYGIVFLSHQMGSFLGAWLGGVIYDHYKSYDVMWWLCIALALVAALLHVPIREKPATRLQAAE